MTKKHTIDRDDIGAGIVLFLIGILIFLGVIGFVKTFSLKEDIQSLIEASNTQYDRANRLDNDISEKVSRSEYNSKIDDIIKSLDSVREYTSDNWSEIRDLDLKLGDRIRGWDKR